MLAGWRSASMEHGGQCVMMAGIPMMPGLCADSWDFLDQVCTVLSAEVAMHCAKGHVHICILSNCTWKIIRVDRLSM